MDTIDLLALRGTRKIVQALKENGPMRYKQLVAVVGFSTTTSRALKSMESLGIVSKKALNEPYRPVEYRLTEKGHKLYELVSSLEKLQ